MTTTTIAANIVTTTIEEFTAFAMDKSTGMTIPVIKAQLDGLGQTYKSNMVKAELIELWFNAARDSIMDEVVETVEAPTLTSDEQIIKAGSIKAIRFGKRYAVEGIAPKVPAKRIIKERLTNEEIEKRGPKYKSTPESSIMPLYKDIKARSTIRMNDTLESQKELDQEQVNNWLAEFGQFDLSVVEYRLYEERKHATRDDSRNYKYIQKDEYGRTLIGEMTVQLPEEYAILRVWDKEAVRDNGGKGMFQNMDFSLFNLDGTRTLNPFEEPTPGVGLLRMKVRRNAQGKVTVSLPVVYNEKQKGTDYEFSHMVLTANRQMKYASGDNAGKYIYTADNNNEFRAMLSAWAQLYMGEFEYTNPANRNQTRDGEQYLQALSFFTRQEGELTAKGSREILAPVSVEQLATVGPYKAQTICGITGEWLDRDLAKDMNDAYKIRNEEQIGERDVNQSQRGVAVIDNSKRIRMKGEMVVPWEFRSTEMVNSAKANYYYRYTVAKSNKKVNEERVKINESSGKGYVATYEQEWARPQNQAIQCLVSKEDSEKWEIGFPADFDAPMGVRIKGVGIALNTSDEVLAYMDPSVGGKMEAVDLDRLIFNQYITKIWETTKNLATISEQELSEVFDLVENPPVLKENQEKRWETAVAGLLQGLKWAQDTEHRKNLEPFPVVFHAGLVEGAVEVHVEEIMTAVMEKEYNGLLGYGKGYEIYEGNLESFHTQLDEEADEVIFQYIEDGTEVAVVGGTDMEKALATASLQHKLGIEIRNYIFNIGREIDIEGALNKFKINKDIKAYLRDALRI